MEAAGLKQPDWSFELVGPNTTLEALAAETQKSNQEDQRDSCVTTGGPVRQTAEVRSTQAK